MLCHLQYRELSIVPPMIPEETPDIAARTVAIAVRSPAVLGTAMCFPLSVHTVDASAIFCIVPSQETVNTVSSAWAPTMVSTSSSSSIKEVGLIAMILRWEEGVTQRNTRLGDIRLIGGNF